MFLYHHSGHFRDRVGPTPEHCINNDSNTLALLEVPGLLHPSPQAPQSTPKTPVLPPVDPWSPAPKSPGFLGKQPEMGKAEPTAQRQTVPAKAYPGLDLFPA